MAKDVFILGGAQTDFARNLERAARGEASLAPPSLLAMLMRMIRGWLGR